MICGTWSFGMSIAFGVTWCIHVLVYAQDFISSIYDIIAPEYVSEP